MSCDVGKATEGSENKLWRRWSDGKVGECAELQCYDSAYVVHFFSGTVYSRGLKFLQVIYESVDRDLTQGFFIHDYLLTKSEFSWTTWNTFGEQVSNTVQQSIVTDI